MTNEEILKKAIKKALNNGWLSNIKSSKDFRETCCDKCVCSFWEDDFITLGHPRSFIFYHDFAKAFFKDEPIGRVYNPKLWWELHLQQMVLEKNPIKYLEKFL